MLKLSGSPLALSSPSSAHKQHPWLGLNSKPLFRPPPMAIHSSNPHSGSNPNPNPSPNPNPNPSLTPTNTPSPIPILISSSNPSPKPILRPRPRPRPSLNPNPNRDPNPSSSSSFTPSPSPNPTPNPDPNPIPCLSPNPSPNPNPSVSAGPNPNPSASPDPNPDPRLDPNPDPRLSLFLDVRDALTEVLYEMGLAAEDAALVAAGAPAYVQSLLDAAREMEDLQMLRSRDGGLSFRLLLMGLVRERRGREVFALLESCGIAARDIPRIARLVSSQKLPDILEKVRFLEELCSSDGNYETLVFRIRNMMSRISLTLDEDLQRTISYFQKMEAERGGLKILSLSGKDAAASIITEFSSILTRDLKPVVACLEALGVPRKNIGSVLLCFPPALFYSEEEFLQRMRSIRKVGVRARDLGKMLVRYPWLLDRNVASNAVEVASFLDSVKVPKPKIDKCITVCPQILGCSTASLQSMVLQMNAVGVKSKRLGAVIARSPQLLARPLRSFQDVILFLEDLGISSLDIERLLKRIPELFSTNVSIFPSKIAFLLELGVPRENLKHVVRMYPEVLLMSVSKGLTPRVDFLLSVGLSKSDIAYMICGFPPLLGNSIGGGLKPKLDFLTMNAGRSVSEVVAYPRYFSYSLEKKIRPRFKVLENRNITCDLKTMLAKNDDEFASDFLGFARMLVPPS